MILLIDNYDSFSYNLYQLIGSIDPNITAVRNDAYKVSDLEKMNPSKIIISPGPGRPENAGISIDAVKYFGGKIPILGVCLGHQAICLAYGGVVSYAKELMHGKQSDANLDLDCPLFKGLGKKIPVARYHSLAVMEDSLPDSLKVISKTDDGEIMGVKHKSYDVYGLQFHPESIMTPDGLKILNNFINL